LRMPSCLPEGCNLSEAILNLDNVSLGDCPELLESEGSCEFRCQMGFEPSGNISCSLGKLIAPSCLWRSSCRPGYQASATSQDCELCGFGWYNPVPGQDCIQCPRGSNTSLPRPWVSLAACGCDALQHENRSHTGELMSCDPCPNNSFIDGTATNSTYQDCKCVDGYMREPREVNKGLVSCRLPQTCNLSQWLVQSNLTGEGRHQLQLGSCAFHDESMQSDEECRLECSTGLAAQEGTDIFTAVDLTLSCQDGKFGRHPPFTTWCSEGSWQLPPLIFLGCTTAVTMAAGIGLELRQHRFERSCARALASKHGPSANKTKQS